ncbi:hypothetical protein L228DRAFT_236133 [Xylona heveae TC161]|uniref:C2H2-type domain-containing protein n=1 Tax=Xylona heveae (strain CBS 132557 / TC161) TaxID=1328760 RepID=A0A165IJK7_XYLHT|nr:hypothetical protein L228DRAFT_236133 [Xylona heveae TC161]KZF24985.1 hypothetical protein L228DRAFT_236133 [Xylona heveae TC161]
MTSAVIHQKAMFGLEEPSDFVLYPGVPRAELAMHTSLRRNPLLESERSSEYLMGTSLDAPFADAFMTTYDAYPSAPAFSSIPPPVFDVNPYGLERSQDDHSHIPFGRTPSGSPAVSATHSFEHPPSILSSASGASIPSAASSAMGSPYSSTTQTFSGVDAWSDFSHGLGLGPSIVHCDSFGQESFTTAALDHDIIWSTDKAQAGFVDPSLIQHLQTPMSQATVTESYPGEIPSFQTSQMPIVQPTSPTPSDASSHSRHRGSSKFKTGNQSPHLRTPSFHPYQHGSGARRLSISSSHSRISHGSPRSGSLEFEDDEKEGRRCPNPECRKVFKDLKAHMLTHQSERPEKCPIVTCEYHQKGFARKYDKNRHTLTHYKGTMVCGFCPGSGSSAEKSFNRADVFKRHLTSVHGVEQTPPNSRKRASTGASSKKPHGYSHDATGKCSTCSGTFSNAQDFYEHLDDCVLRVVQQEDPSEATNERHLASMEGDEALKETLDRHALPSGGSPASQGDRSGDAEDDEADDDWKEEDIDGAVTSGRSATDRGFSGPGAIKSSGVPLVSKGRKKRKDYPLSWGCSADKMKMKKRVLCIYDGPRRLWKDDLMLDNEFEVRMRLGDGKSYVTDLDVQTMKRAEAFHGATEEEKGPWIEDEIAPVDIQELMS